MACAGSVVDPAGCRDAGLSPSVNAGARCCLVCRRSLDPTDRGSIAVGTKVDIKIKVSRTRYGDTVPRVVTGISADQIEATPGTQRGYRVTISTSRPVQTGIEAEIISTANKHSGASWVVDVAGSALRRAAR